MSKSAPYLSVFCTFDLVMCFAPQRCALFRHLNFQKWSENGVFCNVLYILTSKRASRHNSVHFFDISTSKSGPNVKCFVHYLLSFLSITYFLFLYYFFSNLFFIYFIYLYIYLFYLYIYIYLYLFNLYIYNIY